MKVFENRTILKKIIIVLLCVLLLSVFIPKSVKADDDSGLGGKLLNPVLSLFVGLGDGVMSLLEKMILQNDVSLINIDTGASWWSKFWVIVGTLAAIAITVAAIVATGGASTIAVVLKAAKAAITIGTVATISFPLTTSVLEGMFPDSFYLPLYSITPEEIFSNDVLLLDVDFFNPKESEYKKKNDKVKVTTDTVKIIDEKMEELKEKHGFPGLESADKDKDGKLTIYMWEYGDKWYQLTYDSAQEGWTCLRTNKNDHSLDKEYIFGGDNEWVSDTETKTVDKTEVVEEGEEIEIQSTAGAIRSTISNWYTILRDISLVALLSVLVYVGIRIVISSTANDKAKYKQMIVDWIVAICLLFIMQYIMSFSNLLVNKFIELIDSTKVTPTKVEQITDKGEQIDITEPEMFLIKDKDKVEMAYKALVKDQVDDEQIEKEEDSPYYKYFINENSEAVGDKATILAWPAENFTQQARLRLQLLDEEENETYVSIGWKLIYVVLVFFTVIFLFTYLKRVVYMAFLTLIAPLVALTYPIDKMNDGQAQAFNSWFKEYIFNLLLQPMHLIIYTVLISSAMDFASQNVLYVVVALFFMMPAEKLLRKFFGFSKADTPGFLAGPAGAALMMNGVNKLFGKSSKGGKSLNGKNSSGKGDLNPKDEKIKFKDADMLADNYEGKVDNYEGKVDNNSQGGIYNSNKNVSELQQGNDGNNSQSQKPQYIEDRFMNWMGDRKDDIGGVLGAARDSINNNSAVKGAKKLYGKTIGRPIRAIKKLPQHSRFVNAGVQGIKQAANNLGNYSLSRTALNIAKTGAKAYVGGTAGLLAGTIAGAGDPSKAAQYMVGGALTGYKAADSIDSRISNSISNSGIKEASVEGFYADDYNQHLIDKKIKEVQNDYENKEKVLKKFNGDKDKTKDFMKNVVPDYVDYGITDIKDIMAAHTLEDDGIDRKKAISVALNVNEYGKNTSKLGAKDSEDLNKTIENRTRKNKRLTTEKEIQKVSKDTRELFDKYSKIKYAK